MATGTPPLVKQAILWHVAACLAAQKIRQDQLREQLGAGDAHQVTGLVEMSIGRLKASDAFAGSLLIGHDGQSTRSPGAAEMLALALESMSAVKRNDFLVAVPEFVRDQGHLPPTDDGLMAEARKVLRQCSSIGPRRGSVSFRAE